MKKSVPSEIPRLFDIGRCLVSWRSSGEIVSVAGEGSGRGSMVSGDRSAGPKGWQRLRGQGRAQRLKTDMSLSIDTKFGTLNTCISICSHMNELCIVMHFINLSSTHVH